VLGLSYKPDSDVIEESQGLMLARGLAGHGYRVSVFDPLAMDNARAELGDKVTYAPSMESCIYEADTIVIVNPDPAFRLLDISQIRNTGSRTVVVDCWRIFRDQLYGSDLIDYVGLGIGDHDESRTALLAEMWDTRTEADQTR